MISSAANKKTTTWFFGFPLLRMQLIVSTFKSSLIDAPICLFIDLNGNSSVSIHATLVNRNRRCNKVVDTHIGLSMGYTRAFRRDTALGIQFFSCTKCRSRLVFFSAGGGYRSAFLELIDFSTNEKCDVATSRSLSLRNWTSLNEPQNNCHSNRTFASAAGTWITLVVNAQITHGWFQRMSPNDVAAP